MSFLTANTPSALDCIAVLAFIVRNTAPARPKFYQRIKTFVFTLGKAGNGARYEARGAEAEARTGYTSTAPPMRILSIPIFVAAIILPIIFTAVIIAVLVSTVVLSVVTLFVATLSVVTLSVVTLSVVATLSIAVIIVTAWFCGGRSG